MSSVIIGDPKRFGIEFELEVESLASSDLAEWLYGKIRFWCGGQQVGSWSEGTTLRDIEIHSMWVIRGMGRRLDYDLCKMEARGVAKKISAALFEDTGQSDEVVAADSKRYSPFVVSPTVDVFDSWVIILLECGSGSRLIWYSLDELDIHECWLESGEYERVLARFVQLVRGHL